ncbi:EVI5-like protein [Brachyistius frenatus]|uniref:EVI5-like protein n=1 Tax=Brachyistius frenatus TaxID=100188 RepID=UPI0037E7C056
MLNPSSGTQKNLSEEDSSGSDSGSEVSLEPETDRFGFILTNGSTAGSVGPSPELVRQREAKWINIIGQWDRILLKKSSKVKGQCQKGIPASLKAKCWPLLCGATDKMKLNENLYQSLDSQLALQSWVDVIERDLDRQFPFHEMFLSKDGHGQRGLFRVLKAYTQYQPEEGYCQAQGPVAAVLLMNMPAEEAFWCLVQISEQYLPGYYSPLLEGVLFDAAMLTWVLKKTCPAVHKHLQQHGVEPLMFATDWLMCLFTRHLPFNTLLRVWDLFFCYGVRMLLQVAVVLVRRVLGRAEQRKLCQGQMETLEKLRGVREQVLEEDDAFIAEVCAVPLSARDLEKQTEKELEKWRKARPSSTFDPRGRCQGYRMAWARARQTEEEKNRREREKGNLSVPLSRSASTLSLSPAFPHKRWRKGGKVNAGEREGNNRVVRHCSMGAKEDLRSWTGLQFKKVQGVQEEEDIVSEGHKIQSGSKQTGQTELKGLLQKPKIPNLPTEEETVIVKEQIQRVETKITDSEESKLKETEESKVLSDQKEDINSCPAKNQTDENILQPADKTFHNKQVEKLNSVSPSQALEEQSHKSKDQETEVNETTEETAKHAAGNENRAAAEDNRTQTPREAEAHTNTEVETQVSADSCEDMTTQADMKHEESTESENVQQMQVSTDPEVSETRSETSLDSETDKDVEASVDKDQDPPKETETQQKEEDVITETGRDVEASVDKDQDPPKETETPQKEEDVITETGRDVEASVDKDQDPPKETETPQKEEDVITETGRDVEASVDKDQDPPKETETPQKEEDVITETDRDVEASVDKDQDPPKETETQQKEEEVVSETDRGAFEVKYLRYESLVETEEESHTQTKTETALLAPTQEKAEERAATQDKLETETVQTDSEKHTDSDRETPTEEETLILSSPECVQQIESTGFVADTETEAEKPKHTMKDSNEATASEPTQEKEEIVLTVHSEAQGDSDTCTRDQTNADEKPADTHMNEETADKEEASTLNPTTEPDGKSLVETGDFETQGFEQPMSHATMGSVKEEESKENVQENPAGEDNVPTSTQPTEDPLTDSSPQVQDKDSGPPEPLVQTSGHCSSLSSGDFCVRRSSSSQGSRLTRKLSEDLFTTPQKTSQSPLTPEVKHTESQCNPGAENPTQTAPDVTLSAKVTKDAAAQQPQPDTPKRFGLFRRLRGEQNKNTKAKGTPKMQVPKILIQDFSDGTGTGKLVEEEVEEKLSSRERRRKRRERERKEKEEERLKKKREKELEKERERERRKPQTRGKNVQVQKEKGSNDVTRPAKTGSQTLRYSASCAESYF